MSMEQLEFMYLCLSMEFKNGQMIFYLTQKGCNCHSFYSFGKGGKLNNEKVIRSVLISNEKLKKDNF